MYCSIFFLRFCTTEHNATATATSRGCKIYMQNYRRIIYSVILFFTICH